MKLNVILLIGLLFCVQFVYAQEESAEEAFEDGDYFFAREDYDEAVYLYSQVLRSEPENHNAHFKLGMALLNIDGEAVKAIDHLLKATENTVVKYRQNYYPEKRAPYYAWFYLGDAYRMNNQLEEALDAYEKFKSLPDFDKTYNLGITNSAIKSVETAKIIQDNPVNIYQYCYESPVNTGSRDYNAVISANEQVMVWMSSEKLYEAILMSIKVDGDWSAPVNITPQLGSDGNMFPTGLSADGKELLLRVEDVFDNDIFYSKFDGTSWSKAVPLAGKVNSNALEDHASFHPDGNRILVSSARRGTEGGLDLWISERLNDSIWSKPVNLGNTINTDADETSAYFTPDGKKIMFSSKGHFNMGGYDIFTSNLKEENRFDAPVNIGFPINTTTDNTYYVPLKDGSSGIFCIRNEEGIGSTDIWYIEILEKDQQLPEMISRLSNHNFIITLFNRESREEITIRYDAAKDTVMVESDSKKTYDAEFRREKNE